MKLAGDGHMAGFYRIQGEFAPCQPVATSYQTASRLVVKPPKMPVWLDARRTRLTDAQLHTRHAPHQ
jgi:hypothetical protein